jgi:hypothetical protein
MAKDKIISFLFRSLVGEVCGDGFGKGKGNRSEPTSQMFAPTADAVVMRSFLGRCAEDGVVTGVLPFSLFSGSSDASVCRLRAFIFPSTVPLCQVSPLGIVRVAAASLNV